MIENHSDIKCSEEEKKEIIQLIEKISDIADIVRREGIFSITEILPNVDDVPLKLALEYLCDGLDPVDLEEKFKRLIIAEEYSGKNLLERQIVYQGALDIYCNWHQNKLRIHLLSMLGEKWVYDELFSKPDEVNASQRAGKDRGEI